MSFSSIAPTVATRSIGGGSKPLKGGGSAAGALALVLGILPIFLLIAMPAGVCVYYAKRHHDTKLVAVQEAE